jgi:hypothetical protein
MSSPEAAIELDEVEAAPVGPSRRAQRTWERWSAFLGLGLLMVSLLELLATLLEGLGSSGPPGALDRIGSAFASNIGASVGLSVLLGVGLLVVPDVLAKIGTASRRPSWVAARLTTAGLWAAEALAALMALGSLVAVKSKLDQLSAAHQHVTSSVSHQLAAYLVEQLGLAVLAFAAAAAALVVVDRDGDDEATTAASDAPLVPSTAAVEPDPSASAQEPGQSAAEPALGEGVDDVVGEHTPDRPAVVVDHHDRGSSGSS